jgi:hypothetical protein
MRNSSTKTVYLLGGTFSRKATLTLTGSDNGESWLAYPGQTPVLDGGSSVSDAIDTQSITGLTIRFITFQNFEVMGIYGNSSASITIDSNTFLNFQDPTPTTNSAPVLFYKVSNAQVTHNYINNCAGPGIMVESASASDPNNNVTIAYNAVYNTSTNLNDTGAIYILDRGHVSTGQVINNNIIGNYGEAGSSNSKGVYLDDEASNVLVENNIIYGTGEFMFQIHGGNNDVFENNVFDISASQQVGLYQDDVGAGWPNYGMADNRFTDNIVYSTANLPSTLWTYLNQSGGSIALPSVSGNLYYSPDNSSFANGGTIVDSDPTFANPLFVNSTNRDYSLSSGSTALNIGITSIDTSTVGPLAH